MEVLSLTPAGARTFGKARDGIGTRPGSLWNLAQRQIRIPCQEFDSICGQHGNLPPGISEERLDCSVVSPQRGLSAEEEQEAAQEMGTARQEAVWPSAQGAPVFSSTAAPSRFGNICLME